MSSRTGQKVVDKPPASTDVEIIDIETVETPHSNTLEDKSKKSNVKNLNLF